MMSPATNKELKKNIRTILFTICLVSASILIVGWVSYSNGKTYLETAVFNQLVSVKVIKKYAIESYFSSTERLLVSSAQNKLIVDATEELRSAFFANDIAENSTEFLQLRKKAAAYYKSKIGSSIEKNIGALFNGESLMPADGRSIFYQAEYIIDNPNPLGEKNKLDKGIADIGYNKIHSVYHSSIRNMAQGLDLADIFLVDAKTGFVVYSNLKEIDFATNLFSGPHDSSNLAKVFKTALHLSKGETILKDFAFYAPSYFAPAAFMATPIFNLDEERIGVLIFQMPIEQIDHIMTGNKDWENEGFGKSGETYLIGEDSKMRSNSRFLMGNVGQYLNTLKLNKYDEKTIQNISFGKTSILFQEIKTEATANISRGLTGNYIIHDYRNELVLSSYEPLNIKDVKWGIVAEKDKSEAFAPVRELRNIIIYVGTLIFSVTVLITLFFYKYIFV